VTTDSQQTNEMPDWVIPAIVVAVAVFLLVAAGVLYALTRSSAEPETLAAEFEVYTACLRANGADVPLVEVRGDEGFAIIFDDEFLDGGFDPALLGPAIDACNDVVPEDVAFLTGLAGGFDVGFLDGIFGGDMFGEEFFGHGPEHGRGIFGHEGSPREGFDLDRVPDLERGFLPEELCAALEMGDLPPEFPGLKRLADLCDSIGA
jgi:hypothetical protein